MEPDATDERPQAGVVAAWGDEERQPPKQDSTKPVTTGSPTLYRLWAVRVWTLLNEANPNVRTMLPDRPPNEWWREMGVDEVAVRLVKFSAISLVGMLVSRLFAVHVFQGEYDPNYTMEEFGYLYLTPVAIDFLAAFFVGRVHRSSGRDSAWFALPLLLGTVFPTALAETGHLQVSITRHSIECDWTAVTWIFALLGVPTACFFVALHFLWACKDKVLARWVMEVCVVAAVFVAPAGAAGWQHVHFHHWLKGLLGAMCFQFDRRLGLAAQGFAWGIYLNGIGCWGRGAVLPCKNLNRILRTDLHDCYTTTKTTQVVENGKNITKIVTVAAPIIPRCRRPESL